MDETTGVVYFVNQGKDHYLYQIKEGEVQLAVAMPVQQIYPYQGVIYFMIGNSDTYDLQEKHSGDIYCYTPESGAIQLVYEAGNVEGSSYHKLTVTESGIYFCYIIKEEDKGKGGCYHLPFKETEPVRDTKFMTRKGWKDYYFGISCLQSRTPKEDGTREQIPLSMKQKCFCVVGDILYFTDKTRISCIDLNTMEQTAYDFSKAIQKMEGRNHKTIESFTITEAAIWVTTGEYLYRMDLQTETITGATMRYEDGTTYSLATLYTDGKEIYGVNAEGYVVKQEVAVVHILTDSMSDTKTVEVKVEALTE